MRAPTFKLSVAASVALVGLVLLVAAFYDPDRDSESAYLASTEPWVFWSSSVVWLALLAPVWAPSIPKLRSAVTFRLVFGLLGVVLGAFAAYSAMSMESAFGVVFVLFGLVVGIFGVWHIASLR